MLQKQVLNLTLNLHRNKNVTMNEIWRTVPSCPAYEASSSGRIRVNGKLFKGIARSRKGYARIALYKNGKQIQTFVHSLVCEAFHGPRPAGYDCCHSDGSKNNNTPENLRWATHRENIDDAIKHGAFQAGDSHWMRRRAKLGRS